MATQTIFSANNRNVNAAPPVFYLPNATGTAVPVGGARWILTVVSSQYPAGSSADLGIEYQYNGVWQPDANASGFTLGPHLFRGTTTNTNTLSSSIGVGATPYPTAVRLRVDRIDAGRLDSIDVSLIT